MMFRKIGDLFKQKPREGPSASNEPQTSNSQSKNETQSPEEEALKREAQKQIDEVRKQIDDSGLLRLFSNDQEIYDAAINYTENAFEREPDDKPLLTYEESEEQDKTVTEKEMRWAKGVVKENSLGVDKRDLEKEAKIELEAAKQDLKNENLSTSERRKVKHRRQFWDNSINLTSEDRDKSGAEVSPSTSRIPNHTKKDDPLIGTEIEFEPPEATRKRLEEVAKKMSGGRDEESWEEKSRSSSDGSNHKGRSL